MKSTPHNRIHHRFHYWSFWLWDVCLHSSQECLFVVCFSLASSVVRLLKSVSTDQNPKGLIGVGKRWKTGWGYAKRKICILIEVTWKIRDNKRAYCRIFEALMPSRWPDGWNSKHLSSLVKALFLMPVKYIINISR